MKLPWFIALASAGLAVYVLSTDANQQLAGADADSAANEMGSWGTKQRVKGTGGSLLGQAKQGVGKVTGDKQMQGEGVLDEAVGNVKDAAGKAAHAVSDALHNANQS